MGGGGFGGAQGGGGGFFSVPAQFGGGGLGGGEASEGGMGELGGGGMGGFAGGGGYGAAITSIQQAETSLQTYLSESSGETIGSLLEASVAPDSWESYGGDGVIRDLGTTLLVRQTETVHAEVGKFLRDLTTAVTGQGTYQLEVWWLPLAGSHRDEVRDLLEGASTDPDIASRLTTVCETVAGYHGTLLCRERVTTHMASGKQVPVIVGSIPVVGGSSSGDQPIVRTLHLGVMMEARLILVPEYQREAAESGSGPEMDLSFRSSITSRDAQMPEWPEGGKIDRYSMGTHVAEGSCRIQPGQAVLAASLSELASAAETPEGETPELLMVVRVTKTKE